jgi:hypothetical protein
VVQIMEPQIGELRKALDRLDRKLALLRQQHQLPDVPKKGEG